MVLKRHRLNECPRDPSVDCLSCQGIVYQKTGAASISVGGEARYLTYAVLNYLYVIFSQWFGVSRGGCPGSIVLGVQTFSMSGKYLLMNPLISTS